MKNTQLKNFATKLATPSSRNDYVIVSQSELSKFDKLCDIAEQLSLVSHLSPLAESIAQEINEYILEPKSSTKPLLKNIMANIDIIYQDLSHYQEMCEAYEYQEDIVFTNNLSSLVDRLETITTNLQDNIRTLDHIKYTDTYFFRDNVLDRRTISATQRYWKSNITNLKTQFTKERISRTPIQRYFTSSEWLELRNNQQTNISINDIILSTRNRNLPAPTKEEILTQDQIKSERHNDERYVNLYRNAYAYDNYYRRQDAYEAYWRQASE